MSNTRRTRPAARKTPLTFADVRARIQRPRRIAEMVLDAEAAADIEALEEVLDRARRRDDVTGEETAAGVARTLQAAEARADASRVRFVLEAVSHRDYQQLRADHPPTKAQLEEAAKTGETPAFDPDSFAPALVQAQLVEPKPDTDEEFREFWDALSDGQLNRLWTTALAAQLQVTEAGPPSEAAAEVLKAFGLTAD